MAISRTAYKIVSAWVLNLVTFLTMILTVGLRLNFSLKKRIYRPHMTNFSAPKLQSKIISHCMEVSRSIIVDMILTGQ